MLVSVLSDLSFPGGNAGLQWGLRIVGMRLGFGQGMWAGRNGSGRQALTDCKVVFFAGRAAGWEDFVMLGVGACTVLPAAQHMRWEDWGLSCACIAGCPQGPGGMLALWDALYVRCWSFMCAR
jgi:hypothetical protein